MEPTLHSSLSALSWLPSYPFNWSSMDFFSSGLCWTGLEPPRVSLSTLFQRSDTPGQERKMNVGTGQRSIGVGMQLGKLRLDVLLKIAQVSFFWSHVLGQIYSSPKSSLCPFKCPTPVPVSQTGSELRFLCRSSGPHGACRLHRNKATAVRFVSVFFGHWAALDEASSQFPLHLSWASWSWWQSRRI